MVEFKILEAVRRVHRKLANLDFRRADFGLIKDVFWPQQRCSGPKEKRGPRNLGHI